MKVLIANRGEIARRIERTCIDLGHEVGATFVPGDTGSARALLHGELVNIDSYLDGDAIVSAAQAAGYDAIHPGFGFLAENADFARAVIGAGLIWIGPRPDVIEQMGSKINARDIAKAAGVPLIPGFADSQEPDALKRAASDLGYPVLVKAAAGGGGKGIRIARTNAEFDTALTEAITEAERSFGDGAVIVERYIERPRHVEVQVIGDSHANIYHLGTRECSVQRRYQKLFEEAPAPNLEPSTREGLHEAAVTLAATVNYQSAGTVEFIVDDDTGDYYFLEMNTRLQVEHPVTEEVTGLDLVELMLLVAGGAELPDLSEVEISGHALEARITAEDAAAGFVPAVGEIRVLEVPAGVRWESALEVGTPVTPDYDAMVAKLVVHGPERVGALANMRHALDHLLLAGLTTTTGFHRWLVDQPAVVNGRVTTRFLDETEPGPAPDQVPEAAAGLLANLRAGPNASTVWQSASGFSLTPHTPAQIYLMRDGAGDVHEVMIDKDQVRSMPAVDGWAMSPDGQVVAFNLAGHTQYFEVLDRSEGWSPSASDRVGSGNALASPFPAAVAEVHVTPGDQVVGGQILVVIEAMKMLHSLAADGAATIDKVLVSVGDQVSGNQPLVTYAPSEPESTNP